MLELTRKSLVVRMWIHPLNSYVYSIHDLLLSNLKQMINQQESTVQLIYESYNLLNFYID